MWGGIVLVSMAFGLVSLSGYLGDKKDRKVAICCGVSFLAGFLVYMAVSYSNLSGINMSKIEGEGDYYEVIVTTPVPNGGGTLVYAIDLKGDNGKADILAKYPIDGYKIEQVGKRTFLLPEHVRVAQEEKGVIFFFSDDGKEPLRVPPVVTSGK